MISLDLCTVHCQTATDNVALDVIKMNVRFKIASHDQSTRFHLLFFLFHMNEFQPDLVT